MRNEVLQNSKHSRWNISFWVSFITTFIIVQNNVNEFAVTVIIVFVLQSSEPGALGEIGEEGDIGETVISYLTVWI